MARKKQEPLLVGDGPLGKCLIAGKRFRTQQKVASVTGRVIEEDGYGSDYCIDLGDGRVMEPDAPFRFFNHSCEPNCELIIWDDESPPNVCVHALRAIPSGEELTLDYAWGADSAIPCGCETESCRGWIVHPDELEKVLRRERRRVSKRRAKRKPAGTAAR